MNANENTGDTRIYWHQRMTEGTLVFRARGLADYLEALQVAGHQIVRDLLDDRLAWLTVASSQTEKGTVTDELLQEYEIVLAAIKHERANP